MARRASTGEKPVMRRARSPEAREKQLIALAMDCAEEQLMNHTASSQVITHYLKLGTAQAKLELEMLKTQQKLAEAKTKNIESTTQTDEMVRNAINVFKVYAGYHDDED